MELLEMMQNRRSVRVYTGEPVPEDKLEKILQAGLLSACGRGRRPWEIIAVTDKEKLLKMAECRERHVSQFDRAGAAIVVVGSDQINDTWLEDCAIVMTNMHLMADSLGLGSCWIQGWNRTAADGETADAYMRGILGYPEEYSLCATLTVGVIKDHPARHELADLPTEKIHREAY